MDAKGKGPKGDAVMLRTEFCGLEFANPIVVPAGVHGRDGDVMLAVSESGVGGVCTKTIVSQPASDVLPCFSAVRAGMVNSVFGSDKTSEYWFTEGLKRAKEGKANVIANLAGFTPEEAAALAASAVRCGADMIMLPTHCPHMGEILTAMFPEMNFPEPSLTDVEPMKASVRAIKDAVDVPVVVKLSGTYAHITSEWAAGVKESGADGVACADALGPALAINTRTGQPVLGGPRGVGGLTGPAIMPITLRMTLEMAVWSDLPVIGVGGVSTADDVLQYVMAGATLVGVCTAGHMKGTGEYRGLIDDLGKRMGELGIASLEDIRGLTIRRIEQRKADGKIAVTEPMAPGVDAEKCTACGACERVCAYGAMTVGDGNAAAVDDATCIGCGLCVSVCRFDALEQEYYGRTML
ncbi:MAG: 4Fe-4S binding protein [Candidatus Bipolaricaulota bacterium]|nr:MAG: 4Fe-4S binding protein [Candidatus Bipolaricaulota bacterium]